jgi:hypothetical protein
MKALSNIELMELSKKYDLGIKGILNRDNIPNNLADGWYILNLDLAKNDGTHWTCFYYSKLGEKYYYDSMGFFSPEKLDKIMGKYIYNAYQQQSVRSASCGWFCIALIRYMTKNGVSLKSFNEFINLFSSIPSINEIILQDLFKNDTL